MSRRLLFLLKIVGSQRITSVISDVTTLRFSFAFVGRWHPPHGHRSTVAACRREQEELGLALSFFFPHDFHFHCGTVHFGMVQHPFEQALQSTYTVGVLC